MEAIRATLAIYQDATRRGARLAVVNWPVLATVFVYLAILLFAEQIAWRLGLLGGFLMTLVLAACASSFLYLVEMIVRTSKVSLEDFQRSFGAYLWDVVGVLFVLFIARMILALAVSANPQGGLIILFAHILVVVFFNAAPELIYLGHHSATEILAESYRFIADNWIEWFPPNIAMLACLWAIHQVSLPIPFSEVLIEAASALFVYFAMVVRGFLFLELSSTSRRGRVFRHRAR